MKLPRAFFPWDVPLALERIPDLNSILPETAKELF
jgi:hypothetical protein